jgi:hypothetical protein
MVLSNNRTTPVTLTQIPERNSHHRDSGKKPALTYRKLDSWELESEEHVLREGRNGEGRLAVQYVVSGEQKGWDLLLENGARDSMRVFSYPAAELDSLQRWQ